MVLKIKNQENVTDTIELVQHEDGHINVLINGSCIINFLQSGRIITHGEKERWKK